MNFQEFDLEKYNRRLDQASFTTKDYNHNVLSIDDAKAILALAVQDLTNDVLEQIYSTVTESVKSINLELGDDKNST